MTSMTMPIAPVANADTQPFWDGCARGVLLLQRCSSCQTFRHPPSPICPSCLSDRHEWVEAKGSGRIYTYVVVRETRARGWDKLVPYVLAVVTLDEGPRMLTNVVNVAPEDVRIDMPVAVTFVDVDGPTKLPLFQPA